jgi:hypothetical protein
MSYFNHAFKKVFIATNNTPFTGLAGGQLGTTGNIPAKGQICFVDAKSWIVQPTAGTPNKCCPLVLAGGSIYQNDKIGPFAGGYLETNKSKEINPKYVSKFWFSTGCAPQNNVVNVGATPYTDDAAGNTIAIATAGANILDGVYTDVPLLLSPSGSATNYGAEATITVVGGAVTNIVLTNGGTGFSTGATTVVAGYSGFTATTVTSTDVIDVTAITANTLFPQVGQTIYGMTGVPNGVVIEEVLAIDPATGLGTYRISQNATASASVAGLAYVLGYDGAGVLTTPAFTITNTVLPVADCAKTFLCGETYYLRLDIKGSPAMRFLDHNAYLTVSAYTGCCDATAIAPTPVDPGIVMIEWAKQIVNSPLINPFVLPVVATTRGASKQLWYPAGTTVTAPSGWTLGGTLEQFVALPYVAGYTAGLILNGAYVDTKFGDCTFQVSDFYEVEPVRIYASEVDLNGDPCEFSGICVITECQGRQGNGYGETYMRDLILSERYRQNFFATDLRIREITQGTDVFGIPNFGRGTAASPARYNAFYLQHNVPRFNNPSSTFDNDQYLLEVVVQSTVNPNDGANGELFANFVNNWLDACGNNCSDLNTYACTTVCAPVVTTTR